MKKRVIYLSLVGFLCCTSACEEDKIMLYDDANYIQFTRYVTDSMTCSFLAYPDRDELPFPLVVEVVGLPSNQDREYKLAVVAEYTNAPESNYRLPGNLVMPAGKVIDTCYLSINRTPRISTEAVRLTVRLEETPDFKAGQTNKSSAIIYISDVITKPDWWTSSVTSSYLGDYSDEKYRVFIKVTGVAEFDSTNIVELRTYTLMVKNYLSQEKDKGSDYIVREKDGTEMTVRYYGG
ncbi:MAG: DUF4843 domain-containing protein [Odoribacteraceae bacterium]|jgi:hypothetical protein|nr:DUF4843 domain-containing protein [Odoribacteraceae bacterium]